MDEKSESGGVGPDLASALRRARIENAERAEAVADLREIELGRLALHESALQKVVRQAPPGCDLFDLTLSRGDRPRVFLDMVAFIEMARDRRTYRFFQDTLYGRVAIAESAKIETIVAACTNYVARRLVERERALAADVPPPDGDAADGAAHRAAHEALDAEARAERSAPLGAPTGASLPPVRETDPAARNGGLARGLVGALGFFLMALGAATLLSALALAVWLAWTHQLGALWSILRAG